MPPVVKQTMDRALAQFRAFSMAQRVVMIGAAVGVLLFVLVFSRWSGKADMAALYTDLPAADASQITERLASKGVKYQLADQGTTINVPRDQLYSLRLELSADGLPNGGSGGWSILDEQGITTSEFSQQVGYQRALEGELARTVSALDAVQTATVHLVLPKRDAFVRSDTKATASVLIRTRTGKSLTNSHVQAIVNLVSSSVQGLDPAAVTVADTAGNVLNAPGQQAGGLGVGGSTRLEQTRNFEASLSTQIESMLGSVVGVGKAVVTVNADLDFDRSTSTSETFAAPTEDGAGLTTKESTRSEEYQGAVPGNAGVLGPTTAVEGGNGETSYTLQENESSKAVDRKVETKERAPGAIDRLSVAVLVDESVVDARRVTEIQQLVAAAAGIDNARGDQLVVSRLPFDTALADASASEIAALEAQQQRAERLKLYTTIGAVVVVLAILALAYRGFTKSRHNRTDPIDVRLHSAEAEAEATSVFDDDGVDDLLALDPAGLEIPELPVPEMTADELLVARVSAQVTNLVDEQPDEVAVLLRTWLGDRRTVKR